MSSWVRYSVAVYVGLLISGALARQPWQTIHAEPTIAPSVYHDTTSPQDTCPVNPDAGPRLSHDASA